MITIEDVLRVMRRPYDKKGLIAVKQVNADFMRLADCIEAAHKRELAEAVAAKCEVCDEVAVSKMETTTIKTIVIGYFIEYWNEEYKRFDRQNIVFNNCQNVLKHNAELKFRKGTPYRITKDTRITEVICHSAESEVKR